MAKMKIVIADTDVSYLMPLQLKFIEEFFNEINLEIITDKNYFEEYFTTPQSAGILVVSDKLYDASLQRHNIDNIFVMSEVPIENQTQDLNINLIYKYTSINEVFNEITGKSAENLNEIEFSKNEPQIIVITSASGGVGKTAVSVGLCKTLSDNYKKVLYINGAYIQSFEYYLKNKSPVVENEIYMSLKGFKENYYQKMKHIVRKEDFYYIPPFKASLISLGLNYDVFLDIAKSAKASGEYDFIVIDAESVFDEYKNKLMSEADKVIFVGKQDECSIFKMKKLINNITYSRDNCIIVCNDFDGNKKNYINELSPANGSITIEYIEHVCESSENSSIDLFNDKGMQKLASWIM